MTGARVEVHEVAISSGDQCQEPLQPHGEPTKAASCRGALDCPSHAGEAAACPPCPLTVMTGIRPRNSSTWLRNLGTSLLGGSPRSILNTALWKLQVRNSNMQWPWGQHEHVSSLMGSFVHALQNRQRLAGQHLNTDPGKPDHSSQVQARINGSTHYPPHDCVVHSSHVQRVEVGAAPAGREVLELAQPGPQLQLEGHLIRCVCQVLAGRLTQLQVILGGASVP